MWAITVSYSSRPTAKLGRIKEMPSYLTIFGEEKDPSGIVKLVLARQDANPQVTSEHDRWEKAELASEGWHLTVNALRFREPGDRFSKMLLGFSTFIRGHVSAEAISQRDLIERAHRCTLAIGVVGEPEFLEEAGQYDLIWAIAAEVRGLVFDGGALWDSDETLLFDADDTP